MATNFPTSLQDLDATRGTTGQPLSAPNHITHHQLEDDTIEALQAKVGVDNSAVTTSLDYKLKNASSINPGHKHTNTSVTLAFDDLSDVVITSPANGNGLTFNGTNWVNSTTSVADSSTTVKGVTKLSVAPVSPTAPIAVGDNDPRLTTASGGATSASNPIIDTVSLRGGIVMWPTASAPTGWLLCDGSAVSRTTYAALFAILSTTYGVGDGSTTFNLPDLRGRVPVGKNSGTFSSFGATGGEETHTLTIPEMPSHTHDVTGLSNGAAGSPVVYIATNSATPNTVAGAALATGGGGAHNNLQPYLTLNFIIKF